MRQVIATFLVLLMLTACIDRREYAAMHHGLDSLNERNRNDEPFTAADVQPYIDYFDRHGEPNDRLLAYYLLGRAYHEQGEAPMALEQYHKAIECADTLSHDCDFGQLSRVHSQTAALLCDQMLPRQQLEELKLQYFTALQAKDTLCALNAKEQMAVAYDMLGNLDSIIIIGKELESSYIKRNEPHYAAVCSGGMILSLVNLHCYTEAKVCIDKYESGSGFFDDNGNIEKGRELYYGIKGRYYLGVNRYDSAHYYFRKEIEAANNINKSEDAYRGLYILYKQTGQQDSMSKYAELAYETTDAHFQEKQSDELRHMHSLYNYSRNQAIARQKTAEASRSRMLMLSLAFALILTLVSGLFAFSYYRNKKKAQMELMQQHYEHDVEKLEQAKYDLLKMQEEKTILLKAEKEKEIEELQRRLDAYGHLPETKKELEKHLADTDIYIRLRYLAMNPLEKISHEEWQELKQMTDQELPTFRTTLYRNMPNLKQSDYDLCMLDRLYFSPSEIALLTGYSLSSVTMKRVRLLEKIFHISGKGSQFDLLIRNIM